MQQNDKIIDEECEIEMEQAAVRTIFISYSKYDAEQAFRVCAFLEGHGFRCWIAPRDIPAGMDFPGRIMNAIRDCDAFVVISSKKMNESQHICSEVSHAFNSKKIIIPFMIDEVEFTDNYLYYLGNKQWVTAYRAFDEGLERLLDSLTSAPGSAGEGEPPAQPAQRVNSGAHGEEIHIATYQQLVGEGLDAADIARKLVRNDLALYPGISKENEGDASLWAEYLSSYPDTFRYLLKGATDIIGNWSFLAVSEEEHLEKLRSGELMEETFSLDSTEFLLFPGDYIGYLLNLSINIGYNSAENFNMLFSAFSDQMEQFADKGIFFKSWYVNVFRPDHKAMYKGLGFKFLCDNRVHGSVYELDQASLLNSVIITSNEGLKQKYDEHFRQ